MNSLLCKDTFLNGYCALCEYFSLSIQTHYVLLHYFLLTDEFISFVQPGKQFLAVVIINRDTHEVALADKVRLGAGVAGIQHVRDAILSHQILQRER